MFGIVVVVVVWRSRSAGVVKVWWWGSSLCHIVVGVLKVMCQYVRAKVPVLGEICVGLLYSEGGAPSESVVRPRSYDPWQGPTEGVPRCCCIPPLMCDAPGESAVWCTFVAASRKGRAQGAEVFVGKRQVFVRVWCLVSVWCVDVDAR